MAQWLLIPITLVIVALSLIFFLRAKGVKVGTDAEGNATLFGFALKSPTARARAFKALNTLGIHGTLQIGRGSAITNSTQVSNVIATLTAMELMGVTPTNKAPNPFE